MPSQSVAKTGADLIAVGKTEDVLHQERLGPDYTEENAGSPPRKRPALGIPALSLVFQMKKP